MVPVVNEALRRLSEEGIYEKHEMTHDAERMKIRRIQYTPAMEVDGELIVHGDYPGVDDMTDLLREKLKQQTGQE